MIRLCSLLLIQRAGRAWTCLNSIHLHKFCFHLPVSSRLSWRSVLRIWAARLSRWDRPWLSCSHVQRRETSTTQVGAAATHTSSLLFSVLGKLRLSAYASKKMWPLSFYMSCFVKNTQEKEPGSHHVHWHSRGSLILKAQELSVSLLAESTSLSIQRHSLSCWRSAQSLFLFFHMTFRCLNFLRWDWITQLANTRQHNSVVIMAPIWPVWRNEVTQGEQSTATTVVASWHCLGFHIWMKYHI